jgi:carbon-monoxide dehydrogenase medium subunit
MVLGASVHLASTRGIRVVPLKDFYLGVRKTAMEPDEMLVDIAFPAMSASQRGAFAKLALRRAQAISVVNVALVVSMTGSRVEAASIALGAVAPTIIRAAAAESFLPGKVLTDSVVEEAAALVRDASRPIDDLRGSAAYRREMVRVLTAREAGHRDAGAMAFPGFVVAGGGKRPAARRSRRCAHWRAAPIRDQRYASASD